MRDLVVLVVCFVGACGGSKPAPAPEMPANSAAPDCASAAGVVVRSLGDEDTKSEAAAVTTDVTKRCTADQWSAAAVSCLIGATDKTSVKTCSYEHLTQKQADKLQEAAAPLTGVTRAMKKMAEFRDQLCACKDAPCVELVSDSMTKWSQEMAREQRDPPRMTEEDTKQAAEIGEQMGKCMQAAMGAGQPTGPPVALTVTGVDPPKGDIDGGTYIRITGTGFISDGARNVKVYFGKAQGTVVRFASDTELIVEAPGGKAKQTVDVVLEFDPGGVLKLPKAFTFVKK
ncbi:MAG TPA: IPT/TIG domain-containing protein [Kofleriaceae bacterium]